MLDILLLSPRIISECWNASRYTEELVQFVKHCPISRHVNTPSGYVVHEGQRLSEAQEEERPDFGRRVATPDNLKRCTEDRYCSLQPPEFGILVRELQRCDDEFWIAGSAKHAMKGSGAIPSLEVPNCL